MDPVIAAVLQSWTVNPWIIISLVGIAGIYLRGWRQIHQRMPYRFGRGQLLAFQGGLFVLFLALASPLDAFAGLLLQVHMIQHMVLMMVAPPLLLLGAPAIPLLRGLPRSALHGLGPFLAWPALQRLGRVLTHPVVCWLTFVVANITWHIPTLYEVALRVEFWHRVQHLCFLGTALLFWWPVVQPWPSRPWWPRWAMIPYLLLADIQNTALSAFVIFYERVLYPTYATVPRLWGISVLDDQAAAGAIMWVPGSVAFLVPAGLLITYLLDPPRSRRSPIQRGAAMLAEAGAAQTHPPRLPRRAASKPGPMSRLGNRTLPLLFTSAAVLLGGAHAVWGHHGGEVRLMEQSGPFLITVFTAPSPFRAGPVDISVLIQERDRGRPILTAEVTVRLREQGTNRAPLVTVATRQNATNRLLYATLVDVPVPGRWELEVMVQQGTRSANVACTLLVAPRQPFLRSFWSYLTMLTVAVGLIVLHRWLTRRHSFGARAHTAGEETTALAHGRKSVASPSARPSLARLCGKESI